MVRCVECTRLRGAFRGEAGTSRPACGGVVEARRGYISSDEMPDKFYGAAWILDVGDVSRPVKTEYGYHLIKLVDKKPVMSFERARDAVHNRMIEEKRSAKRGAWLEKLMAGHTITIDSNLARRYLYQPEDTE